MKVNIDPLSLYHKRRNQIHLKKQYKGNDESSLITLSYDKYSVVQPLGLFCKGKPDEISQQGQY